VTTIVGPPDEETAKQMGWKIIPKISNTNW
jgi:hypothetical protein